MATKDTMATTVPDDTDAKTKSEKKGTAARTASTADKKTAAGRKSAAGKKTSSSSAASKSTARKSSAKAAAPAKPTRKRAASKSAKAVKDETEEMAKTEELANEDSSDDLDDVQVDEDGLENLDDDLDDVDDGVHGFGRAGVYGRLLDAQALCVHVVFLDIALGDGVEVNALFVRLVDYLVVNVSEVLHELNLVAAVLEVTAQQIENDERTCVADMEVVVHSWAAGIHLYLARRDRNEFFLLTGQCVVEFHGFYLLLEMFSAGSAPADKIFTVIDG